MAKSIVMRQSKEIRDLINWIRAKYIMSGKTPPSVSNISKVLANKTDKEELLNECFIRF